MREARHLDTLIKNKNRIQEETNKQENINPEE